MDVIYKIEIDTPDGDVEIEVSVEDGDFCISMEDKLDGDMVAVALSDESLDNLVKAIFAAKAYKKSLQGKTKKDTPSSIRLKVGDRVLLSDGCVGNVEKYDEVCDEYHIVWCDEDGVKRDDWFGLDERDVVTQVVSIVD